MHLAVASISSAKSRSDRRLVRALTRGLGDVSHTIGETEAASRAAVVGGSWGRSSPRAAPVRRHPAAIVPNKMALRTRFLLLTTPYSPMREA